jgi:hypothetical protein
MSNTNTSNTPEPETQTESVPQPTIVEGHEYHQYDSERYVYVGKDEDTGTPEFVDFGRVAERNARAAAAADSGDY